MSFADLEQGVIERDLCTVCGLCEAACPQDIIRFDSDQRAPRMEPETAYDDCGSCNLCFDICPGADPETPESEQELFGRTRSQSERWLGICEDVLGVRARDEAVYAASASGGGATTLAEASFQSNGTTAVLVSGREEERPWRAAPVLCRDPGDLKSYAQATYQLSPHLRILRPILQDASSTDKVAVVGLACHMQAIRKLQRHPSEIGTRARDRITTLIELACSSSTLPLGTETFLEDQMGVDLQDVVDMRYRDNGYPGEFAVITRNDERLAVPVWRIIRHLKDYKTHRCLSCGDWWSGLADVSVCDGDPNIFISSQDPALRHEKFGTVVVRTGRGAEIVSLAESDGLLETWRSRIDGDLHLGLLRKRSRRAFYENSACAVPLGPIPGFREAFEPLDDEKLVSPATPVLASPAREFRLDMLTETELTLIQGGDVLLLPLGSFEPHGHLPLGTDRIIGEAILKEMARREAGLWLFPAIPVGHNFKYGSWPGAAGVSSNTLADIVENIGEAAGNLGLKRLFVMSGHDENREGAVIGLRDLEKRCGIKSIYCDWLDLGVRLAKTISSSRREGHASEIQTSVIHLLLSETRYPAATGENAEITLDADELFGEPERGEWIKSASLRDGARSFTGDPSKATATKGHLIFERIVSRGIELTQALRRLDVEPEP